MQKKLLKKFDIKYKVKNESLNLDVKGNLNILPKDIGPIKLYSRVASKQATISKVSYTQPQLQTITAAEKLKDPQGFFTDEFLQKIIKTLKTTLLPFALAQIAKFGITNAEEALGKNIEDLNVYALLI